MPISNLTPDDLRFMVDPATLGFADTAELLREPLPWIGQERAETAARFGLRMEQADYNLFVLGEVGSGRSSLLHQEMLSVAAGRAVPPDLCYLHNFDAPERPRALRMPAGQGRQFRQLMAALTGHCRPKCPSGSKGRNSRPAANSLRRRTRRRRRRHFPNWRLSARHAVLRCAVKTAIWCSPCAARTARP